MGDTARLASPASKKKVPVLNSRFLIVSVAGLIGAVVSLSLLWLTRKIEQAKYHRSIGQNDESVERS